ncbi:WXG100 family type VII secretion target [Williamsia deligens]|uniref:WXG100 family type VII secretion target n=1 Tax=Williamsia deligens TaxID=321325 RepID=A0ABW3G7B1_9NOCA|nr:WXG100 family type VII secretion target [Williamsia deligens]MCP2192738.1 hypothetical protein [Williamsia deligens]
MSGLTRSQLESWQPEQLETMAASWRKTGASIESLFSRYVDAVNQTSGSYWEGIAAESAQSRATADKKTAIRVVDTLENLASTAEQGYHAIDAHVKAAKSAIQGAESNQFSVGEDFTVTDLIAGPPSDGAREAARVSWQTAINDAAIAAFNADLTTKQTLDGLRSGLIATFTNAATLSGQQGTSDGRQLVEHPNDLSPEEQERLKDAGSLTPDQIARLQAGDTAAIPASQMEYINALSRSLDGKSPQEIKAAMDKMPPESRSAVANALQIGSNSKVTASVVGDKDVPTNGGMALLPKQMQASLTRDDLVRTSTPGRVGAPGSGAADKQFALSGVANNQAIAAIAGGGDHRLQAGSDLDRSLADVGAKYLHAQVQVEQSPHASLMVDGHGAEPGHALTESIFSNIGDDKNVVASMVNDPHTGMQFVNDVQTHGWSDDGKAVGRLFTFGDNDFDNPRTGQIMEAVARASSSNDAWATLSSIPGTDGKSVGELNPELLRTLSKSMAPYISDLAGAAHSPGFSTGDWADDGNGKYVGAANVFALMNTDDQAGQVFDAAAYNHQLGLEHTYGQNPTAPGSGADLVGAGRVQGLVDEGTYLAARDEYGEQAVQQAYERKEQAFNQMNNLAGLGISHLPVGSDEAQTALNMGGDQLKNALIGSKPDSGPSPDAPEPLGPRVNMNYWNVLQGAGKLDPAVTNEFPWAVNEDGTLRSYQEMRSSGVNDTDVTNGLEKMFNSLNNRRDSTSFDEAYDTVVQYRHDDKK